VLSTTLFFLLNAGTIVLFRGPKFGGTLAHPDPWTLPVVVVGCAMLLVFPAVLGLGYQRPWLGVVNLAVLVAARGCLFVSGAAIRSRMPHKSLFRRRLGGRKPNAGGGRSE